MYKLTNKEFKERKTNNYLNAVIQAGLLSKIEGIETAIKVMIERYNDISEIQLDYDNYKMIYAPGLKYFSNASLKNISKERQLVLDKICNMRNELIAPAPIKISEEDQENLLNDPEETFDKKIINLYINTTWCDEPLPF